VAEVWELSHPARPWTVNSERGRGGAAGHWSKTAALTKEWRFAFFVYAKQAKIPRLQSAFVTVRQFTPDRRRPDPGSIYPAVKAAIDGVIDAGVLPDDGPEYIDGLLFEPAAVGTGNEMVLIIEGVPA
jgi:crossover junction endodeoxyribonuclease RusA